MTADKWFEILRFAAFIGASFGSGWATAILSDVSATKAIASGIVTACAYVLGNQQMPVKK